MATTKSLRSNIHIEFNWKWALAIGVILLFIGAWFFLPVKEWARDFGEFAQGLGAWGVLAFAVIYIIATVALVPGSPLSIAMGVAYGLWGIPLALGSAIVGAGLAFLIGRYAARERVKKYMKEKPKIKTIQTAINHDGWKVVFLLRLSPVIPFNLQNYFFGTTEIGFWPYAAATAAGIVPGTILYVYLGSLGSAESDSSSGLRWAFFAVGIVATAIVVWMVKRKSKKLFGSKHSK